MIGSAKSAACARKGLFRLITVICLSVHLILTVLLSNAYMVEEAHHICSEDDCPICDNLRLCDLLLRQTSSGVSVPVMVYKVPLYSAEALPDYRCLWNGFNPVGDKVRMND